jgi:aryl carrier-like protein
LILYKLVSARDRDMSDVQAIVKRQKGLDAVYLRKWADWWDKEGVEGTRKRLDAVLSSRHS